MEGQMDYQDLKTAIRGHLNSAAEDFFLVGSCSGR